MKSAIKTEKQH